MLLIVFVIVGGFVYAYARLLQKNKSSADVTDQYYLEPLSMGASVCHSGSETCNIKWDNPDFPASFPHSIPRTVASHASKIMTKHIDKCINAFVAKYPDPKSFPPLPINFKFQNCSLKVTKQVSTGNYKVKISDKFQGSTPGIFKSIYKNGDTNKTENTPFQFDTAVTYNNSDLTYKDKKWTFSLSEDFIFSGKADTNYSISVDGYNNLAKDIIDSAFITFTKKVWEMHSQGLIDGYIKMSWNTKDVTDPAGFNIDNLTFCPNGCQLNVQEKLDLAGNILQNPDDPNKGYGPFNKKQNHQEIFIGKGQADPKTVKLEWTEFKVVKSDNRSWWKQLTFPMSSQPGLPMGSTSQTATYSGSSDSSANEFPLKGAGEYDVETLINKTLDVKNDSDNSNLFYVNETNKKTKNQNGSVTERSGSGTRKYSVPYLGLYSELSGIFDLPQINLLVNVSNDVKYPVGSRIDLFADSVIQKYLVDVVPEYFQVPGFFTASTDYKVGSTSVATKPLMAYPSHFYAINLGGTTFDKAILNQLNDLAKDMKLHGVIVPDTVPITINRSKDFQNFLASVSENSWILLMTHGSPATVFGVWTWRDVQEAITDYGNRKQFRFDTMLFATTACYGGRGSAVFQPLGSEFIGALNLVLQEATPGAIGSIVIIDNNAWDHSVGTILQTLEDKFSSICQP